MLAGLSLAAQAPLGPAEKGANSYSLQKEAALGRQLAADFRQRTTSIDSPAVHNHLDRLGHRIAAELRDAKLPFTFSVVADDPCRTIHEPAALPGGYVFVPGALFVETRNEAEFAGMLAHAMSHIAARHGTRQASRGTIANLATIPLIFMGGWAGYGARQAAGVVIPVGFLKFSRGFESEADLLGLEYMYKTGYDPTAFVDFFEKIQTLEKKKPGTMSKIFSSHPMTDDRIQTAQKNIQEILKAKPEYVVTTSEFDSVKDRLMAMHNRRKIDDKDANKPKLRKAPGSGTGPIEGESGDSKKGDDSEDRPTLKRRN